MNKQITDTSDMPLEEILSKLDETLKSEQSALGGTDFVFARWLISNPDEVPASLARNYLRLVEELLARRASPTEFTEAMLEGDTTDPQAGLHYMDAQQELSRIWNSRHLRMQNGLPPGITNTANWSEDELLEKLESVKVNLDWRNTTGSAEKWWNAFEAENKTRLPLVLRLAEELQVRKATITEFFLAYVYSNTDNIQANLSYLDYTRLKKEEERKKKEAAARALENAAGSGPDSINASPAAAQEVPGSRSGVLMSERSRPSDDPKKPITSGDQSDDVTNLDLPTKVVSALSKSGIVSISHLRMLTRKDLLELPGIGSSACDKILAALKKHN